MEMFAATYLIASKEKRWNLLKKKLPKLDVRADTINNLDKCFPLCGDVKDLRDSLNQCCLVKRYKKSIDEGLNELQQLKAHLNKWEVSQKFLFDVCLTPQVKDFCGTYFEVVSVPSGKRNLEVLGTGGRYEKIVNQIRARWSRAPINVLAYGVEISVDALNVVYNDTGTQCVPVAAGNLESLVVSAMQLCLSNEYDMNTINM